MVQEFQVLRCSSCQVFQVHQVKKSKKWACKLCGEKQSLLKVYGQGSGADCRHHVQKLNLLQGQAEQAATGAAGESCQNAISDDDIGDDVKQSLMVSQEAAPMSRWDKYLEENSEEEEGLISAHHEHYYSHQDCTPRTVRKRKQLSYHGGDFNKEDIIENISKKNKIYEGGNTSKTSQFSCRVTGDTGCLEWHDKHISHTLPLQTCSDTFLPMNKLEGHCKESTCSTTSFLKMEPKMDTIFSHFDHSKKIGPDCSVTSSQDVLPNEEPTTTNRLSAQISSPGLHKSGLRSADQLSDIILKKPIIQSNLFQTDEDFDDNY